MTGWTVYHSAATAQAVLRDERGHVVHSVTAPSIEAALRAIERMHRVRVMPRQAKCRGQAVAEGACATL